MSTLIQQEKSKVRSAGQALEHLIWLDQNALVSDLYDMDADLRAALQILIPDFEYPDISHNTIAEVAGRFEFGPDRLEAIKTSHAATTPGEWVLDGHCITVGERCVVDCSDSYGDSDEDPEDEELNAQAIQIAHAGMDLMIKNAETLRAVHETLEALGFGRDEPINGGDVVEAVAELFDRIEKAVAPLREGEVVPVAKAPKPKI